MKITKSYKIILLLTAFILVVSSMFCSVFFSPSTADAAGVATSANSYFSGLGNNQVKFDGGYVVATVKEDSRTEEIAENDKVTTIEHGVLKVANKLAVNDLEMVFAIPAELKSMTLVVKSPAYYANGNIVAEKVNGNYVQKVDATVTNEIEFNFATNTAKVNGKTSKSFSLDVGKLTVKTSINNQNYLEFAVSGGTIVADDVMDGSTLVASKKIKNIDGVSAANISFKFALKNATAPAEFKIQSIDQKASDASENYKQTFETDTNGVITDKNVYPVVDINESFYKNNADGTYSVVKNLMIKYTLTLTPYTVLGNVAASELYIQDGNDNMWLSTEEKPKSFMFKTTGNYNFSIVAKNGADEVVYKTVSGVQVVNFANDENAPEYVYNADAYAAYMVALENAYYNVEEGHHTSLGSSMTIPSLKDFVFDDIQTYEGMAKTVYYNTNTTEDKSSSGMSISLSETGKYVFNVVLGDNNGNVMNKDNDFESGAKYEKFVFTFDMVDDAPISVTAAPVQGNGCVDVKYTASKFEVDAVGCKTTYKLYYKANEQATEWKEIPKASNVTDTAYNKDGFTYDMIKAIGYDGSLTFTPNAKGLYKIECEAVSSVTSRSDAAETVITVDKAPSVVKVYTDWLANNVWSVVFLSIGTLCLIGIVVLLCIKPKDEVE